MKSLRIFAALLFVPALLPAEANRWTSSSLGVGIVRRIYTAPQDPAEAFAFTPAGIYKTTDGGQSWRSANRGLPSADIRAFAAETDTRLFVLIAAKTFASDDGGEHWYPRTSLQVGGSDVRALAFDPKSKTLIAGTFAGSLYISSDGGQSWKGSVVQGLALDTIDFIAVSATAAYAGSNGSPAVLRSADGGRTWERLAVTVKSPLYTDPSTSWVYAQAGDSVMVSKDEAKTWTALASRSDGINKIVTAGDSVYVVTNQGVVAYGDGAPSAQTIASFPVNDFAVAEFTPRLFYAAPQRGIVTSVEGSAAWTPSDTGLPGTNVSDVDIASTDPSTAYATSDAGVFRTNDGGKDWVLVNTVIDATHVAVSPSTSDTAYFSSAAFEGIQRTRDRGATWKTVTPNVASVLAIAPSDPKTLYAAFGQGMSKSTDGGDSWSTINNSLFLGYYPGYFAATSIAVDPSNASNVVMSTYDGIATTSNGGASWSMDSWDESQVSGITVDPSNPAMIFGGNGRWDYRTQTYLIGAIRSTNGGGTWSPAGLSDKRVTSLVMRGGSLYAGTADGRIYRSDDRGQSWIGFDQGTSIGEVNRLAADSAGKHFLAATSSGIYRYDLPDSVIAPVPVAEDALGVPETLDAIASSPQQNAALIVPIAGSVRGAGGTMFTTELLLSNANATAQQVRITWLPRGGDGGIASFDLTIPAGGSVDLLDFAERVSRDGVGSLIVRAIDASGNLDANASIDASTIVWSDSRDGRAPASQAIPAARANLLGAHHVAFENGLRNDAQFRVNAGIVNLSAEPHQFTVQINGESSSGQFTIAVPPLSVVQTSLPDGDYGLLTLEVVADAPDVRWLLYGTSIDRTTGAAETSLSTSYE